MTTNDLDLGHGHSLRFTRWAPDRGLNPQYAAHPNVDKYGAIVAHRLPDGTVCRGIITFDGSVQRALSSAHDAFWQVVSWDPLTLMPSLLCRCGDHGFITAGRWVPA